MKQVKKISEPNCRIVAFGQELGYVTEKFMGFVVKMQKQIAHRFDGVAKPAL